jgi:hypothetical protein
MIGCRRFFFLAGLLLASLLQIAGACADVPPAAAGDPPEAVGRIAVTSGAVSFRVAPSQSATTARLNFPLSLGNVVETAPPAHATIDIAAGRFYLDGGTRLRIGALTDGVSAVMLEQGALVLHVLPGGTGQVFTIETARSAFRVDQPGYYEVEVGQGGAPTTVSALEGGAQFRTADHGEQVLHPGERIVFASASAAPQRGTVVEDDLIRRVADEIAAIGENEAAAPEHVSSQITGFQDLARYGIWELTESYGPVWRPQVGSDWTPYSRGQWVDIAPWGQTWVDDAPWGFAPFHYGRWVVLNRRWAWLPGETAAPPVYAPALVSFFDTPKDQGAARRWIPLGPEEPYLPPYRTSIVYFRAINAPALPPVVKITNIVNIVQITNVVQIVNRRPVLIFNRLVNRPGAPPPRPRPRANGTVGPSAPAMVVTQSGPLPPQFQTGPSLRPAGSEIRMQTGGPSGSVVIISSSPGPTMGAPEPGFLVTPSQPDPPIIVIRNFPPGSGGGGSGGGTTPPPPVVVPRNIPAANNPTLGTGTGLGTQATMPPPPTVTFGASPGANGVTFGGQ